MNRAAGHGVLFGSTRARFSTSFVRGTVEGRSALLHYLKGEGVTIHYKHGSLDAMHFLNEVDGHHHAPTVVLFLGMGNVFEELGNWFYVESSIIHRYQLAGFNILAWNYPNVLGSSGSPSLSHVLSGGDAVVHYLMETHHVKPKEIIIHGHSMGGGIALEFAAQRDKDGNLKYPEISVCCDRSFSSLEEAIRGHFSRIPVLGRPGGLVCGKFVSSLCRWKLVSRDNWRPQDSTGHYWCIHHLHDEMIPERASIATYLREKHIDEDCILELEASNTFTWTPGGATVDYARVYRDPSHERPLNAPEWGLHLTHLERAVPGRVNFNSLPVQRKRKHRKHHRKHAHSG